MPLVSRGTFQSKVLKKHFLLILLQSEDHFFTTKNHLCNKKTGCYMFLMKRYSLKKTLSVDCYWRNQASCSFVSMNILVNISTTRWKCERFKTSRYQKDHIIVRGRWSCSQKASHVRVFLCASVWRHISRQSSILLEWLLSSSASDWPDHLQATRTLPPSLPVPCKMSGTSQQTRPSQTASSPQINTLLRNKPDERRHMLLMRSLGYRSLQNHLW